MHELGSVNKNRFNDDVILDALSVRCRRVLILELQLLGMSRGSVHHQGALLTIRHLATQQVRSTPEWCRSTLPSSRSARRVGCWLAVGRETSQNLGSWREACKIDKSIQRENKIETRHQSFEARVRSSKKLSMVCDVCWIWVTGVLSAFEDLWTCHSHLSVAQN